MGKSPVCLRGIRRARPIFAAQTSGYRDAVEQRESALMLLRGEQDFGRVVRVFRYRQSKFWPAFQRPGVAAEGFDMNSRDRQQVRYFPLAPRFRQQLNAHRSSDGGARQSAAAAAFCGAFLGCLVTLHLGAGGFSPAIASALATVLLCGLVLATRTTSRFPEEFFAAIYGGSFAGMTPVLRLIDDMPGPVMSANAMFVLLSIVCGVVFWVVAEIDTRSGRRVAGSCGGRSGAIAAAASFLFVQVASLFGAHGAMVPATGLFDVAPMSAALACAACAIGTFATLIVLRRPGVESAAPVDRIFIAAAVALTGLWALRLTDASVPDAFYAGCFLGMSAPRRLKGWIQPCFAAILLAAILVPVRALLPGIGGSLGLAALVTLAILAVLPPIAVPTIGFRSAMKPNEAATEASANGGTGSGLKRRALSGGAIIVAGSVAALLAIAYFVRPALVGPQQSTLAASARRAEPSAPVPAQPASFEASPTVTAGALNDDPKAMTADLKASGVAINDAPDSRQDLLDGFLRWQSTHPDGMPPPVPLPVRPSRNPAAPLARLAPTGAAMPSQPVQKRLPNRPTLVSATVTAASSARTNPPGPIRNSGPRSAPGQTVP
jgi:hypothetical protein